MEFGIGFNFCVWFSVVGLYCISIRLYDCGCGFRIGFVFFCFLVWLWFGLDLDMDQFGEGLLELFTCGLFLFGDLLCLFCCFCLSPGGGLAQLVNLTGSCLAGCGW